MRERLSRALAMNQAGKDRHNDNRMGAKHMKHAARTALGALAALFAVGTHPALAAWEPVRPVEFIVPAGTGGGADQMARTIQGIVTKHNLTKQPLVVINKSGGAGGEGFLDVK